MKAYLPFAVIIGLVSFSPGISIAQNEISTIPFETVPGGTAMVASNSVIGLEADTNVTGSVAATGEIESGAGFRFPDSTLQLTAAAGASTTANSGLYSNTIAAFTPPNAYTEICIKAGDVFFDIHVASESTAGGDCLPGDVGWIIERFEREAGTQVSWHVARLECLKDGMRLPEPFEWSVTCDDAASFAISDMEDAWEWAANAVESDVSVGGNSIVKGVVMGNGSCAHGSEAGVYSSTGSSSTSEYRCAR